MMAWHPPDHLTTRPPFSTLFSIDPTVCSAIATDMLTNGFDQSKPVDVWLTLAGDRVVVDGHTRLEAARDAGLREVMTFERRFVDEHEAVLYAIHNQRDRRNLGPDDIVHAVKTYDGVVRKQQGGNRNPTGANQYQEVKGSRDPLTSNPQRSAEIIADALGVSASTVKRARRIYDDPDAMAAVEQGMSIYSVAERGLRKPQVSTVPVRTRERVDDEPWFRAKDHGAIIEATIGAALAEVNRRLAQAEREGLDLTELIARDRRVGTAWRKALKEARALTRAVRLVAEQTTEDTIAAD